MRKLLALIFLMLFTTQTFAIESNFASLSVMPNEIRHSHDSLYTQTVFEEQIQYPGFHDISNYFNNLELYTKFENFQRDLNSAAKKITFIAKIAYKAANEILRFFLVDAETPGRIY